MKLINPALFLLPLALLVSCTGRKDKQIPLSLHPQNPHYFLFRGDPAILIGSTEHYGAVMNLDFDYIKYLNEVAASGLNLTRTFSGVYVEPGGAFGIRKNTLAPAANRYIAPWIRSTEPGYANGGNKFDLSEWDEAYFARLKDFITQAGIRKIVVELDLFSNYYDTVQWKLSPLYIQNNINRIGNINDHKEILSLKHPEIVEVQEIMVRKIINELKDFDNIYYEICNEPYFGDTIALGEWEKHMTGVVVEAEKDFAHKHIISNNVANNYKLVPVPRTGVAIYNFHYARPPRTVAMNYRLNRVIGDNETGFDGIADVTYRNEAWDFILAGGGLFNHLDYSFTTGSEDGTYIVEKGQPGGGGETLRNQLKILSEFMKSIDYINMTPLKSDMIRVPEYENISLQALTKTNEVYAVHLHSKNTTSVKSVIEINIPAGSYNISWIDTKSGAETVSNLKNDQDGWISVTSPEYSDDIALRLKKER
jgi:hypothetical protein